jgi:hypothetical protein
MNFTLKEKYTVLFFDTSSGKKIKETTIDNFHTECPLPSFEKDLAIYLRQM